MTQLTKMAGRESVLLSSAKAAVAVVLFLVTTQISVHAQWTTNGANINNTNTGNVGVGTANPEAGLHVATESGATPRGVIVQQSNSANNGAYLILRKSRGTIASPSAIVNGDSLGTIYAEAHTGSAYIRTGANIKFLSNGTVAADSVPTDILFYAGSSGIGNEYMRITSAGNVGIGTAAPASLLTVSANTSGLQAPGTLFPGTIFHVSGGDNAKARLLFDAFGAGFLPQLTYRYARGTAAAPTAVQSGDGLGQITASGYRATGYANGSRATFTFLATENWTDTANGTAIAFNTTPNGGSTPFERLRIDHSGSVGIGTASPVFDANVSRFLTLDGGSGAIGSIGAAGGTSSNGTAVGQVAFVNSNLGTTDKRVATIVGSTDAATNSGVLDLYTASAGSWGLPKMRVMSGGNVGIGTMSPGFRLDVQGGQLNASGGLCMAGDCKTAWSQVGGSQWTNSSSNIYFNTGNVGVGTTAPGSPLEVRKDQNAGTILYLNNATAGSGTGAGTGIRFYENATLNAHIFSANSGSSGYAGGVRALQFWNFQNSPILFATNSVERVRFDPAGNVGIGTATPNKSGATKALTVNGTTDSLYELAIGDVRKGTVFHDGSELSLNNNVSGPVVLRTNNAEKFRVDTSGNVGIGTSSPAYSLDVNGGTNGFRAKASTTSSNDSIATFESAAGIQAIVRANGNVGIGVTSPTERLEIAGNLKLTGTGNITASGNLAVSGTINAKYQDVAEWVESSQTLSAGTVVVLDHTKSNQVIASSQAYDTRVAGVISLQPGITLGEKSETKVLVATTGRVKIKVDATSAPIHVGDLLVTSDVAGFAKKSQPLMLGGVQIHRPGTLIGKALEPLEQGKGEILVLLSLQ